MKKIFLVLFIFILIHFQYSIYAQQDRIDSLLLVLRSSTVDTIQINTLSELSRLHNSTGNYQDALKYAIDAQQQSQKVNFKTGLGNAFNNIGSVYWNEGSYENALENYFKALEIRKEAKDKKGISGSLNNIALVYMNQGDYGKSMEFHLKSLKIREEIGDKKGTLSSYNNIGNIYRNQGNYEKALENYFKSMNVNDENDIILPNNTISKKGIGNFYNNIGLVNMNQGDYERSLKNYQKSLKVRKEIGDRKAVADSYNNIGNVYMDMINYKEALNNHLKSLKIREEIGDKYGIAMSNVNIGGIYLKENRLVESYDYLNRALILFKRIGYKDGIKDAYFSLSDLHAQKGDYKKAFEFHKLYFNSKDTLFNEKSSKQIAEMNTKYDSEKKDKELLKKDLEMSKQLVETEKQYLQRNVFIIGFALVLALSFFIFRGYRLKQNANKLLEKKNILIENQRQLMEENNGKITDSIKYAKRIQHAILPSRDFIKSVLPDSFVFFKPKDIVSGDFYWIHAIDKDQVMLAVVDCTGHGVPGALMSMMGFNLLEQIVKEHQIYEPGIILDELSKLVMDSLKQTNELSSVKEGMDIALLKINNLTKELEFAGARNSLYLIRNRELTELKADRRSIGISFSQAVPFSSYKIKIEKGDCLYAFSDGYADQFGGPNNEKFYYHPFRELLIDISQQNMEEQEEKLEKVISEWKGHKAQIDDMLVIGVRV
ncbi:MAG: tetratricopeptide repeat protein [Bacteroidota bacterium]|nr:tetratricopeptide repeat protein [Bacteroidota bacterium]